MTTDQEQTDTQKPIASYEAHAGNEQHASSVAEDDKKPMAPARKRMFLIAGVVILILTSIGIWWLISRNYENTDDAQINGYIHPISSRVVGTIVGVSVENNQRVYAGEPLVDLDPKDYQVALAQAKANYDQTQAQSTAEKPNLPITVVSNATDESTGRAEVIAAQASLAAAQYDDDAAAAKLVSSGPTMPRPSQT